MKFCVNCANFVLQDGLEHKPELGLCSRVEGSRDPVTGSYDGGRRWQWAKVVRTSYAPAGVSYCGSEGKYWVAKEAAATMSYGLMGGDEFVTRDSLKRNVTGDMSNV